MTPPTIAPVFFDFRLGFVDVLIGPDMVMIDDDGGREFVEVVVCGSERVEGTGARSSGRPPAAFAATGSNLSPI